MIELSAPTCGLHVPEIWFRRHLGTDGSRAEGCLFGCWPLLNREGTHGRGLQPGRAEWRASSAWRVTVGKVQQF